jgi:hypothetical protein
VQLTIEDNIPAFSVFREHLPPLWFGFMGAEALDPAGEMYDV